MAAYFCSISSSIASAHFSRSMSLSPRLSFFALPSLNLPGYVFAIAGLSFLGRFSWASPSAFLYSSICGNARTQLPSVFFHLRYAGNSRGKADLMKPNSIVIINLHTPKEKVWGMLLEINPSGATIRGIDLNSFDHFIRQLNEPDAERVGLPTVFFPT